MIININLKPFVHQNIYQVYSKDQDYIVNLWHQQLPLCMLYILQFQKAPFILPIQSRVTAWTLKDSYFIKNNKPGVMPSRKFKLVLNSGFLWFWRHLRKEYSDSVWLYLDIFFKFYNVNNFYFLWLFLYPVTFLHCYYPEWCIWDVNIQMRDFPNSKEGSEGKAFW